MNYLIYKYTHIFNFFKYRIRKILVIIFKLYQRIKYPLIIKNIISVSRRYVPDRNVFSFQQPQFFNEENKKVEQNIQNFDEPAYQTFDQLPIID